MQTGPNGERRPYDPNACAVAVMKIATGQVKEQKKTREREGDRTLVPQAANSRA